MKTKLTTYLFLLGICILISGCYPYSTAYVDELDLVITDYDPAFTFTGHQNYAIPDSVVKITGNKAAGEPPVFIQPAYSTLIINRIKSNMSALGYTLVTDITQADVILFPSALETTYAEYYYDYYYYWGWYYPYGGWYYPYQTVTTYTTGTLLMNMVVAGQTSATGNLHVAWTGLINGVLDYYGTDGDNRLTKAIDQSFTQSSYLHQ
jgi:hypothetical protein